MGTAVISRIYNDYKRIVVYSRDEAKHQALKKKFPEYPDNKMRYIVGDICDYDNLLRAMRGCDTVIHCAAMKHIDQCEYNPVEAIRVNVNGSLNVARACDESGIKQALFISTDKACAPVSHYGACKSVVEHLWTNYNHLSHCRYNTCRYGNVWGSRGSFLHSWKTAKEIEITHKDMSRFFWTIEDASEFCVRMLREGNQRADRGCIYIPKMSAYRMWDIAEKFTNNIVETLFRCPEKIYEDLISIHEAPNTYQLDDYYIIYPFYCQWAKDLPVTGEWVGNRFQLTSEVNGNDQKEIPL